MACASASLREYMSRKLFAKADEQSIDLIERAIGDLRKLGATIVDPGPEGELFTAVHRPLCARAAERGVRPSVPQLFPVDAAGQPTGDHIATLLDLHADPKRVPEHALAAQPSAAASALPAKAST